MSDKTYVLALDVGTSSVRAILYDRQARPVPGAAVHVRHEPRMGPDGTSEMDADELADLTWATVVQLVAGAGAPLASSVAGVGVSSFWHGLVATDDSARALSPLDRWSDTRSWKSAENLRDRFDPEAVRQRTGCPIHASYWPAKLAWLRSEGADLWSRPVRWMSFGDVLFWRMFGRLGTSVSMASGTGLFGLADCSWDQELLSVLEISPASLPPIAHVEQTLTPSYQRLLPNLAGIPWLHALGDGALANLGSACVTPDRRALTVGTSGALRAVDSAPPTHIPPGLWGYRLEGGRVESGGALSNGGHLRAWLVK